MLISVLLCHILSIYLFRLLKSIMSVAFWVTKPSRGDEEKKKKNCKWLYVNTLSYVHPSSPIGLVGKLSLKRLRANRKRIKLELTKGFP